MSLVKFAIRLIQLSIIRYTNIHYLYSIQNRFNCVGIHKCIALFQKKKKTNIYYICNRPIGYLILIQFYFS